MAFEKSIFIGSMETIVDVPSSVFACLLSGLLGFLSLFPVTDDGVFLGHTKKQRRRPKTDANAMAKYGKRLSSFGCFGAPFTVR